MVAESDELGAEKVDVCVTWTTVGWTVEVGRTVVWARVSTAGWVIVGAGAVEVIRATPPSMTELITPMTPP